MRRSNITKTQLITLTQDVLRAFYGRSIASHIHYLSDDFIWIGAFDFQFATSKQEFLEIIQSEISAIPFEMQDEHYDFITRDRDTFILYCKFTLTSACQNGTRLQMHTRLTVVWKHIDGALKLVHVHGSNAQDIPLSVPVQTDDSGDASDFIDYITTNANTPTHKRMFRQASGKHCILLEEDIVYLQADGQNTRIYTQTDCLLVSGILQTHQAHLSDTFYRIHKSYLINSVHLTDFQRYKATLSHTITLPIGKERYLPFKSFIASTLTAQ